MSNSTDKLSTASRAMLVGAMVGGGASVLSQLKAHQKGEVSTEQLVKSAGKSAVQGGAIGGATTYVAEKMAGRPVLSLLTLLSVGTAGVYLYDQVSKKSHEQE